ncbi:MAG: MFS transporter [Christensenellales bacterium]
MSIPKGKRIPLFLVSVALYWFSFFCYMPILTEYVRAFSTTQMTGTIIASYGLMQVIFRVPIGMLSDKLKMRKYFVTGACALAALATLGMALVPISGWALVFRALMGIAVSTWVPYSALFSSYVKDDAAGQNIGLMVTSNYSGQMLGTLLGGWVISLTGQMNTAFFISVAAAALCMFCSLFLVEQKKSDFPENPEPFKEQVKVLKSPMLVWAAILFAIMQLPTFGGVYGFSPTFATQNAAADTSQLGIMSTLVTVTAIVGASVSSKLPDWLRGMENCLLLSFVLLTIYCITIPFIRSMALFYALHLVFGFVRGLATSQTMSIAICDIDPAKRGTAMGFYQAIYGIGMALGPQLVGLFGRSALGQVNLPGLTLGYMVMAALQVVGAVCSVTVVKKLLHKSCASTAA